MLKSVLTYAVWFSREDDDGKVTVGISAEEDDGRQRVVSSAVFEPWDTWDEIGAWIWQRFRLDQDITV